MLCTFKTTRVCKHFCARECAFNRETARWRVGGEIACVKSSNVWCAATIRRYKIRCQRRDAVHLQNVTAQWLSDCRPGEVGSLMVEASVVQHEAAISATHIPTRLVVIVLLMAAFLLLLRVACHAQDPGLQWGTSRHLSDCENQQREKKTK